MLMGARFQCGGISEFLGRPPLVPINNDAPLPSFVTFKVIFFNFYLDLLRIFITVTLCFAWLY